MWLEYIYTYCVTTKAIKVPLINVQGQEIGNSIAFNCNIDAIRKSEGARRDNSENAYELHEYATDLIRALRRLPNRYINYRARRGPGSRLGCFVAKSCYCQCHLLSIVSLSINCLKRRRQLTTFYLIVILNPPACRNMISPRSTTNWALTHELSKVKHWIFFSTYVSTFC